MFERKLTHREVALIHQIETFIREKHCHQEGHDTSHVLTVTDYTIQIAKAIPEGVNPFVLIVSALFHDLGRINADTGILHGLEGAALVREYLNCAWVSSDDLEEIVRIIARHTPTTKIPPETVEERVIFDADALDRLGMIGMLRGLMGKRGSTAGILRDRMQKRLRDYGKLHFEASRQIGEPLQQETLDIVARFRNALESQAQAVANTPWPVDRGVEITIEPLSYISWLYETSDAREWQRGTNSEPPDIGRMLTRRETLLIEEIAEFIESKQRNEKAHDYAHVLQVLDYALRIAAAVSEKVDPFVLICGALFHDLGWVGADTGDRHGLRGAVLADEYLAATWVSREMQLQIRRAVVRHTDRSQLPPETVEEKILWDADKLAGLGRLGLLRRIIATSGSTEAIVESSLRFAEEYFDRLHFVASRRIGESLREETNVTAQRFRSALTDRKQRISELRLP